jgi:transcriptional regulator with XRE-family HTH domain
MPANRPRSLNPLAQDAAKRLGLLVAIGRRQRLWSQDELAQRVGTTAKTIRQIERGDPSVGVGLYFQAAVLTGVALFNVEPGPRVRMEMDAESTELALLPKRVRRRKVDNDF